MEKFQRNQVKVTAETSVSSKGEPRIVKPEALFTREISEFSPGAIGTQGRGTYRETKARFGALAATDGDRRSKPARDSHFSLNPLVRDPLAIEAEEKQHIEERVSERVLAIAEDAKRKAAQEGYRDGLAKGHEEAFIKMREESGERLGHLETLIKGLEGAKDEIFRTNERFLVDLVYRIAKQVLLDELKADRGYVLRLARELIERVGVRDNIRIRIHPDEAASIGMLAEGLAKSLGELKNLNIEPSYLVARGGCQVETEWNAIDATLDTQLAGIHDALIGEAEAGARAGEARDSNEPPPASGSDGEPAK